MTDTAPHKRQQYLAPMVRMRQRLWWLGAINKAGALLTALWLLYRVYDAGGFWHAVLAGIFLGIVSWPGPAFVFAIAASVLCFHYKAVGLWLPILAYCSAGVALVLDFRLARRVETVKASETEMIGGDPEKLMEDMNSDEWSRQLSDIVAELGDNNPLIEIRVYPEKELSPAAPSLFTARPQDLEVTVTRLRDEFGGGTFPVIVFVGGKIRRRFMLLAQRRK